MGAATSSARRSTTATCGWCGGCAPCDVTAGRSGRWR
jgi:hypothetical protein